MSLEQEKLNMTYVQKWKKQMNDKVPIYRGCPNTDSSVGCFCTGICKQIIGYRDKHPLEK
jgi:hypothetical protein